MAEAVRHLAEGDGLPGPALRKVPDKLVLLSGSTREGGTVDGRFRRVVTFPDDGHPDLTAAVLDLTGDARDEVVLWDQERWIESP